jgi:hypothetical protein
LAYTFFRWDSTVWGDDEECGGHLLVRPALGNELGHSALTRCELSGGGCPPADSRQLRARHRLAAASFTARSKGWMAIDDERDDTYGGAECK